MSSLSRFRLSLSSSAATHRFAQAVLCAHATHFITAFCLCRLRAAALYLTCAGAALRAPHAPPPLFPCHLRRAVPPLTLALAILLITASWVYHIFSWADTTLPPQARLRWAWWAAVPPHNTPICLAFPHLYAPQPCRRTISTY